MSIFASPDVFTVNGPHYYSTQAVNMGGSQVALSLQTTSSGTLTLIEERVLLVDPQGTSVDLLLPPEADDGSLNAVVTIVNVADAAESVVVKLDDDTTTIETLTQNSAGTYFCNGTRWFKIG